MPQNIRAGAITGNPTAGLCNRVCIEVKRVFDGCREDFGNQTYVLQLNVPPQATAPLTFVKAESYGTPTVTVVGAVAEGNRIRFTADVTIPVIVTFADTYGNAFTSLSSILLRRTPLLSVPQNTIAPYELQVWAAFESRIGSFISADSVSVTGCIVLIFKIIVTADILVPTYGNCEYPQCNDGGRECAAFLSLPLYP